MSIKALQDYTFVSKYAQWLPEKKRRETWSETVDRVKQMMLQKYADKPDVHDEIEWAYSMMQRKRVLGSQRALQFGGPEILRHNMKIFNCQGSYCDRPEFFQECMYLLLCGCGTGFSVQKRNVSKLPKVLKEKTGKARFVIPDSIEGWSDAIGILINSYFDGPIFQEYSGKTVEFDYSQIRQEGSLIGKSGRKAPGPDGLKRSIAKIRRLLDSVVVRCQNEGVNSSSQLRPIDAYDIVMHSSDAVLSGGIRRSATICLFSHDDEEMLKAKTGSWFVDNPQRGRSNNSVLLLRDQTSFEDFKRIMESVKEYGEPGFIWVDSLDFCTNPCCEIGFYPVDIESGLSGWQACNLSTINCAKVTCREDFLEAAKAAAIIGTLQAGFTDVGYLTQTSKKIFERESLIGVSGTGWMETPDICLDESLQKEAASLVVKTNEYISSLIGISPAARTTCVKPEGTASCILGTSSGIHPHHAIRYIRNVQANKNETIYKYFKSINPRACSHSVWSNNDTDDVISFCVEVEKGAKTKNQVGAVELLEHVKKAQMNWVESGKVKERCTKEWISHNVSNTINVKPDEWDDVTQKIYDDRKYYCGVSLLPVTGDKDFCQAPFSAVYLPSQILKYYGEGVLFVSGLIEDSLRLFEDNLWEACDSILGVGKPIKGKEKTTLRDRCAKFADRYFGGNLKQLTYAMKDVYNYKYWTELKREYKDVDYTLCVEEENSTKAEQEWACSGGSCEIR